VAALALPGFDWTAWRTPDGERFVAAPERIATADATTLQRLATLLVRAERFDEGFFATMVRDGQVRALAERLAVMRADPLAARIAVLEGDITKHAVDAIVNAANSSLLGGGGVDGAIHRGAGPQLLEECRMLNGCKTGQAKATGAYRLPAKAVLHTVGPVWRGGNHDEEALLSSCHRACLELARTRGLRSVSFPAISTGAYRFPMARAAAIAVATVRAVLADAPELEVHFVCFGADAWDAFASALRA
jgi:O-acetyl-ADP-ribose deacetylase (regulator of RNase III)